MGDDGPMCSLSSEPPPEEERLPQAPGEGAQLALLANPAARQGQAAGYVARVLDCLRARGVEPLVLDSASSAEAHAAARHVVEQEIPRLVVVGGDGVVHLAADAVAGSRTVLGVVAAGTGNDFAAALDLDRDDLEGRVHNALAEPVAVDLIARRPFPVPIGTSHIGTVDRTGGTTHASTVCIAGFPAAVNARAEAMTLPRGPSRYTVATLLAIRGMRPTRFRLTCHGGPDDGRVVDQRCAVVAVANTGFFGGGMRISPDARPDDGLLDVCLVGDVGRVALLRAFPKVRTGAHLDHPKVIALRAAEVDLEILEPRLDLDGEVRADGEPFGTLPCTLSSRPGALRVAGAATQPLGRA